MDLVGLANRGNIPVLETLWAFAAARHEVLANNIANIDTPDFKAKRLDPALFQDTLRQAVERRGPRPTGRLELSATDQFHLDDRGFLVATPGEEPVHNVLFHDGTNARIEIEMANLAENTMTYTLASQLLRNYFEGLKKAIRGQI